MIAAQEPSESVPKKRQRIFSFDSSSFAYVIQLYMIERTYLHSGLSMMTSPLNTEGKHTWMAFDRLEEGFIAEVEIMVCLKWEAKTLLGEYISTDYLFSDRKGNIIQCSSSKDVSHSVSPILEEGFVYRVQNLFATPNNDRHGVSKDSDFVLLFQSSTAVTKMDCVGDGFVRYPFQFIQFEDIRYVDSNYLIDVIGSVFSIGSLKTKLGRCNYVDCELINERGVRLMTNLWGPACDEFHSLNVSSSLQTPVMFTGMSIQQFKGEIYLASTMDSIVRKVSNYTDLPGLHSTMPRFHRNRFLNYIALKKNTFDLTATNSSIAEVLLWASSNNKPRYFNCTITVEQVQFNRTWYHYLCLNPRCKRALTRIEMVYWCDKCETLVTCPDIRLKLQLRAHDETGELILTVFDDTIEKLTKKSSAELIEEIEQGEPYSRDMPKSLYDLVKTTQTVQINSCTYYPKQESVEFVCSDVCPTTL